MKITVTKTQCPKPKPEDEGKLGFARTFSDHMFVAEYEPDRGWFDPRIVPYQKIALDPASPVFHYAQEIFEGAKAYALDNGEVGLFRIGDNAKRLNRSAQRMCMPEIDIDLQVEAIKRLVDLDRDWVPTSEGTSLYLRPAMIADGTSLGAHTATRFIYFIICSPTGTYYQQGMKPIRIRIETRHVRAVKGGVGRAKTGGNYAASFKASYDARQEGFNEVLWLDGREQKYVQEVGAMNMMFVIDGKLVTSELGDTILPGITRESVITLAREKGMEVIEDKVAVDYLFDAFEKGLLTEAFGTGTAAVISPVGELAWNERTMILNDFAIGPVSLMFYEELVGIQRQRLPDKHGWTSVVPRYEQE
jgi:branched-chain amino acid aminotransferase